MSLGDDNRLLELVPAVVDRMPAVLHEARGLSTEQHPDHAGYLAEEFDEVLAAAEVPIGRLIAPAGDGQIRVPPEEG